MIQTDLGSLILIWITPKELSLSNQALNQMRKTRTQAHHQKTYETPGGLKLFTLFWVNIYLKVINLFPIFSFKEGKQLRFG